MNKLYRYLLLVLAFVFLLTAAPLQASTTIPVTGAQTLDLAVGGTLPSLDSFIDQVKGGPASQVTGLYAVEIFAYPVLQQPSSQLGFVSQTDGTVTQFGLATSYGSLGFLAHNTLAGVSFANIKQYQLIAVVYGDGHATFYKVTQIRRFQATSPSSPYSAFVDLSNNKTLTATDLFQQTYAVKDTLVLQTCITMNDVDTWGRLFIIATPYTREPIDLQHSSAQELPTDSLIQR
jgi:hypothetical protein